MTSHPQNSHSEYTLRKMYEFYKGPIYKMFSKLPLYKTQINPEQIMRYKMIMGSMTDIEIDGPKPDEMSVARKTEIARASRQDLEQVNKMLRDYKKLERVWRRVEKYMSDTMRMDRCALFWHEIATPFYVEVVPEPDNITEVVDEKSPKKDKSNIKEVLETSSCDNDKGLSNGINKLCERLEKPLRLIFLVVSIYAVAAFVLGKENRKR